MTEPVKADMVHPARVLLDGLRGLGMKACDRLRLPPLITVGKFVLDLFAIFERFESIALNLAVVDKYILTFRTHNEPVPLFGVKPLDIPLY